MADPTPISVILPTTGWNDACEEIAAQLRSGDELLVVCDAAAESVAERIDDRPDEVRLVVAGEPEGCSGKANAIAAGMDAAECDRLVWSDDDYHHPPDWLDGLRSDYERYGPTTEVPVFVGRDPLAKLLEPTHVISGTLAVSLAGVPWGGSLVFERDDIDEEAFLADLRRTVSDDGLLMEYADITSVDRTRRVEIGGSVRETLENQVRFAKIVRHHEPTAIVGQFVLGTVLTAGCVLFPLPALVLLTVAMAGVYAAFGVRRWTFLAAYPVALAAIPLLAYGLVRRTFVWGGRRYRWRGKFDVSVKME
ncbi:glycosyltransferase family 2 protein [Haloterrigena sp. SYSU A558-1]|uniref:Glycosyltransferase family 2 protein n=1 Tax=Haloterrigena gelatinilytica TaxID=2741724 RepID=A0ABX2LHG8_9EURY|nr:glycosyltransferase family 2 protein [Haloterrigena gelatinilytica]NUC73052.1 glycosyltransferase family 2 protein [Haloterrigena gelatinilytica]